MTTQNAAYQAKGWFEFDFPEFEEWCEAKKMEADDEGYDAYQDAWTEAAHTHIDRNVNVYEDAYYFNVEER